MKLAAWILEREGDNFSGSDMLADLKNVKKVTFNEKDRSSLKVWLADGEVTVRLPNYYTIMIEAEDE